MSTRLPLPPAPLYDIIVVTLDGQSYPSWDGPFNYDQVEEYLHNIRSEGYSHWPGDGLASWFPYSQIKRVDIRRLRVDIRRLNDDE